MIDIENLSISTYIINQPDSIERRDHIVGQFKEKPEFDISIIDACSHENEAFGQWLTIRKVIELAISKDDHVIIICEGDHEFTSSYSKIFLFQNIIQAQKQRCDYFSGGTAGFNFAVPISENRFWTNHCTSTQFIVLYRSLFKKILNEPFDESIIAGLKLSQLAANKMILFPFISIQKDFGHSNSIAPNAEQMSVVQTWFAQSSERLRIMQDSFVRHCYPKKVQPVDTLLV